MENTTTIAPPTDSTINVLVIDVGSDPIKTEKLTFPITERELAKVTVLSTMNRMGKNSEAIVKHNGEMFSYVHTSKRGPSEKLFRSKIQYHPLAGQL